ncbi:MAG: hypothetical protein DU429_02920 [Candidatus Tokpelaia sp.]|uniref:spore coat protein U domain-containing protein n=1 Tax=Candidatus Tokpelaia sp. TaxID=2233777 RepID=UPI0012384125|nr:spore coat protein U domain-containing protein [Candidatus Tokpelaia sp.]KAA6205208.1 MAG: hypothetical protein DU430_05675 [Candidatus Tokpelaia sp.]KAA6207419.1 MAG: hypothetical protein DU429_02920 [Candidatus Tokpelaia sp.]KAA6405072.1 hypothetical protein DPQ22_05775 [Candidatus Tokpelaia sp.]
MKIRVTALCLCAFAFIGLSTGAGAADGATTAELDIQLTVKQGCDLSFDNSQNIFSFAPVSFLSQVQELQGSFSIVCNAALFSGKAITVKLNSGSVNSADTPMNRALYKDGDLQHRLLFQVYKETSAAGNVWGDNSDGATPYTVSLDSTGAAQNKPFIIQLLQQKLDEFSPGTYSNTLTVTVDYGDITGSE